MSTVVTASRKSAVTRERRFLPFSDNLESKLLLAGGYDPANTSVTEGEARLLVNADDAGNYYGKGSQLHRMAIYAFEGSNGDIPIYGYALPAAAGGAAATQDITITGVPATTGTLVFRVQSYLASEAISIGVSLTDTPTTIGDNLVTAITNIPSLPCTAVNAGGVVTLTSKTADETGNDVSTTVSITQSEQDNVPGGITVAVASPSGGAGTSDISGLLNDLTNDTIGFWVTDIVVPYSSQTVFAEIEAAIGNPNQATGLYAYGNYRPFNSWHATTASGTTGLNNAIALAGANPDNPAIVYMAAPTYGEQTFEISAISAGAVARQASVQPSNNYTDLVLSALFGPLDRSNCYTTTFSVRSTMGADGVSPIIPKDSTSVLGDITTTWNPQGTADAPLKFVVSQRKTWNIQNSTDITFNSSEYERRPTVFNVSATDQSVRAIDTGIIETVIAQLAGIWERKAWIYEAAFTAKNAVATQTAADKFEVQVPVNLSGNFRQGDVEIGVDRNPALVGVIIGG